MSLIPSLSLKCPKPYLLSPNSVSNFSILHSKNRYLSSQAIKNVKGLNGGSLNTVACSTSSPLIGRVGLHRREGNLSLLSFGANSRSFYVEDEKADYSQVLSALLPFVVALTAVAALSQPSTFTWVSKEMYAPALGGIMLSIGIRLSIDDFALAIKRPLPLSVGFIAQYVLKPALGILVAQAFGMPQSFYAGFVLMSCVAGAQLSSYASFLSKSDVAFSILLTSSSTIASVLVTPLLTGLLIGSVVPVDAVAMSKSILQVVLLPVTLGLALNTYAKPVVSVIQPVMPFVAMICTSLCIGSPLAINRAQILSAEGARLIGPVLTFHAVAFAVGYWLSKLPFFRFEEEVCRTVSLCTGMQSSTLAGLLATQFLGSTQAVPPACSVVAMAIMGLCLASFWGSGYRIRDIPSVLFLQTASTIKPSQ
ncbi:PREDICTED: probable sodium/metabolite cotransporter BASS3, chloroplastic [Nicotiana attenuata]|uniref:Sodiummetabolite cotransporter bass3, chloroplastic n=1 Tax=Nicotiana attenuata TaxID=49451 RepID=A0A314KMJ2_NICAT|nr:PREDICTED: probable sodium/metabolite cotransporter BASS3, chloroplastic [Nicotiana attenuata]OIT30508.1 putative sodiummetabolite cotransporter bass3, chloroplastic [Nicotiana attenuata]